MVVTRSRSRSKEPEHAQASGLPNASRKTEQTNTTETKTREKSNKEKSKTISKLERIEEVPSSPVHPSVPVPGDDGLPSPMVSEGPEFTEPLTVGKEVIDAARKDVFPRIGLGFDNHQNFVCYRNAVVIMLLYCDRIMSWIKNRHIPNLQDAGLTIKTAVENHLSKKKQKQKSDDLLYYTDVWCELHELQKVYLSQPDQRILNSAMSTFWDFVGRAKGSPIHWPKRGQQDAGEFLDWLIGVSIGRLHQFYDTQQKKKISKDHRLEENQLQKILNLAQMTIHEIMMISQTKRMTCVACRHKKNVKHRIGTPNEATVWTVPLGVTEIDPETSEVRRKLFPTLEECLQTELKGKQQGYRCPECYEPWSKSKTAHLASITDQEQRRIAAKKWEQEADRYINLQSDMWKRLYSLPETLILPLLRFQELVQADGSAAYEKDETIVDIPHTLDLAGFLEKRLPTGLTTKYHLVSIVSHAGTREGGHYVSYARRDDDWYEFDDLDVTKVDFDEILLGEKGLTPYILLYEKDAGANETDGGEGRGGTSDKIDEEETKHVPEDESVCHHEDQRTAKLKHQVGGGRSVGGDSEEPNLTPYVPRLIFEETSIPIKIASRLTPGLDEMFFQIDAQINGCQILFPKFLLEGCKTPNIRHSGSVTLSLEDSAGRTGSIEGRAHLALAKDIRDGFRQSAPPEPGRKRKSRTPPQGGSDPSPKKKQKRDSGNGASSGSVADADADASNGASPGSKTGRRSPEMEAASGGNRRTSDQKATAEAIAAENAKANGNDTTIDAADPESAEGDTTYIYRKIDEAEKEQAEAEAKAAVQISKANGSLFEDDTENFETPFKTFLKEQRLNANAEIDGTSGISPAGSTTIGGLDGTVDYSASKSKSHNPSIRYKLKSNQPISTIKSKHSSLGTRRSASPQQQQTQRQTQGRTRVATLSQRERPGGAQGPKPITQGQQQQEPRQLRSRIRKRSASTSGVADGRRTRRRMTMVSFPALSPNDADDESDVEFGRLMARHEAKRAATGMAMGVRTGAPEDPSQEGLTWNHLVKSKGL